MKCTWDELLRLERALLPHASGTREEKSSLADAFTLKFL